MTDVKPLLSVDGVAAVYNHSIAALHNVSLTVNSGEIRAILGGNGAGKTTTLHAIANLLYAERGVVAAGTIWFDGIDVLKSRPSDLVRAGLISVLEGRHVFKSLTVDENLRSGGISRGSSRAEISTDLERVYTLFPSLVRKRRLIAGLTSGGEQQMIAIGRALMTKPRLLLLDEPSMGLAPLVVANIFETLKALNVSEGLTVLMAEQNAAVALRYAHTATIIENGTTVLSARADDLRQRSDIKDFYLGSAVAHPTESVRAETRVTNAPHRPKLPTQLAAAE